MKAKKNKIFVLHPVFVNSTGSASLVKLILNTYLTKKTGSRSCLNGIVVVLFTSFCV